MKIRSLEAFPWRGSTLLKLFTDSGVTGWGECSALGSTAVEHARTAIVGQDASRYEPIRAQLPGPAGAAVNMALLDIVGHTAKAPVCQVLGGPTRSKIRAFTAWSDGAVAAGYRAFSAPPGAAMPEPYDFVVDANGKLSPGEAASLAARLEKSLPLWLDEPCAMVNLGAARKIADESVTPLGWGRHIDSLAGIQNLLREQMIDVIRLDISRHGISSIRKAAALAETYYVAVAPYHAGGPVATAAALHLAASLPNFFIQQIPWTQGDEAKIRSELIGAELEKPKDGFLSIPSGNGLGIQINESALRRYAA